MLPTLRHTSAVLVLQEAAGAFGMCKDTESMKVDNPRPVDLSPECCALLEKIMLAQAQVRRGGYRAL
jgi:hypothetical protein